MAKSLRRASLQSLLMTPQQTIEQVLVQAGPEHAQKLFQDMMRSCVRVGLMNVMGDEVELLCGPKHHPDSSSDFKRAGSENGHAYINGTKESIKRPRVRTRDAGENGSEEEVVLESYALASDRKGIFDSVVDVIAAGMPVRGVENCFGGAVKRSQASEMWIEKSREMLDELRGRSLVAEDWLALWIDGVFIGNDQCVIVAIGLHADGTKEVLDFEPGASENAEMCRVLLERISERGFAPPPERRLLVLRDGAKALKSAVKRIWSNAVQQECLVHYERIVHAKLPKKAQEEANRLFNRLRKAEGETAGEEAFEELHTHVETYNSEAAVQLDERRDVLLAFHQLNVSAAMNVTFLSTNIIENVMRNWRKSTHHIKRWRLVKSDMISRWSAAGLMKAESGFRRVKGHEKLDELCEALKIANSKEGE